MLTAEIRAQLNGLPRIKCKNCGDSFYRLKDGYCDACYRKLFTRCEDCGEVIATASAIGGICRNCFVSRANRKRVTHKVACGVVSYQGIRQISEILDYPDYPATWKWETMVRGKGEYVGSLAKRLAKLVYQTKGAKLDNSTLGQIGSLINANTNKRTEYTFDITKRFNWSAGDFGDDGSCYWGCRSEARGMLENEGCLAIRFYDEESGEGYARAWLMPLDSERYIVFNGYGEETIDCARILASFLSYSYRKIRLSNNGDDSGTIYINGGMGYLIGKEEAINGASSWDFEIDDDCGECCDDCECRVSREEMNCVGDRHVCDDCLSSNYSYCEQCDEYYACEDVSEVHRTRRDGSLESRYVCDDCRRSHYTQCDDCGEYFDNTLTAYDKHGNEIEICHKCAENNFSVCEDCDCLTEDATEIREGRYSKYVCPSCLDNYHKCADCGEYRSEAHEIAGQFYCGDCVESHTDNRQLHLELEGVA